MARRKKPPAGRKPRRACLHAGHRVRLRKKAAAYGLDPFEPHEAVELLLFESRPRVNTNEIAHRLLAASGSLKALFAERREALLRQKGIGPASARLIASVLPSAAERMTDSLRGEEPFSRWTLLVTADFRLNILGECAAVLPLSAGKRVLGWIEARGPESLLSAAADMLNEIWTCAGSEGGERAEEAERPAPAAFLVLLRRDLADGLLSAAPDPASAGGGRDCGRDDLDDRGEEDLRQIFPEAAGIYVLYPDRRMEEVRPPALPEKGADHVPENR